MRASLVAVSVLVALLGVPTAADAQWGAWLEKIEKLSGPSIDAFGLKLAIKRDEQVRVQLADVAQVEDRLERIGELEATVASIIDSLLRGEPAAADRDSVLRTARDLLRQARFERDTLVAAADGFLDVWDPGWGSVGIAPSYGWSREDDDVTRRSLALTWEPRLFNFTRAFVGLIAGVAGHAWRGDDIDDFESVAFPLHIYSDYFFWRKGSFDAAVQVTAGPTLFHLPDDAFEPLYPTSPEWEVAWQFGMGVKIGWFAIL